MIVCGAMPNSARSRKDKCSECAFPEMVGQDYRPKRCKYCWARAMGGLVLGFRQMLEAREKHKPLVDFC